MENGSSQAAEPRDKDAKEKSGEKERKSTRRIELRRKNLEAERTGGIEGETLCYSGNRRVQGSAWPVVSTQVAGLLLSAGA